MPTQEPSYLTERERLKDRFDRVRVVKLTGNTAAFDEALLLLGITAWNLEHWIMRPDPTPTENQTP